MLVVVQEPDREVLEKQSSAAEQWNGAKWAKVGWQCGGDWIGDVMMVGSIDSGHGMDWVDWMD